MFQTQILQFVLHPSDSDAIRQRRIDFQRLLRNFLPSFLTEMFKSSHVVEPIGQLDDHDANIVRHREHHLAEIFSLLLFRTLKGDLPYLCHAVDEMNDFLPEFTLKLIGRRDRILQRIV